MEDSKSNADKATMQDHADNVTLDIGAEQKEKEKYQSEPEGKVKFGDYLVCIHIQSLAFDKTDIALANRGFSHTLRNGIWHYYWLDLWLQ